MSPVERSVWSDHGSDSDVKFNSGTASPSLESSTSSPASFLGESLIRETFEASKTQWIDDPVVSQWRNPEHRIHKVLEEVGGLYTKWEKVQGAPFALSPDPIWLDTGRALSSIGLPWHQNHLNLPEYIDTSMPFDFKDFEAQLIQTKGARVGEPSPSGYVTGYEEANLYCIRALQQELRMQFPSYKPLLVYDHFDFELIRLMEKFLGLESHHVCLSGVLDDLRRTLLSATLNATRPIIFATSLSNSTAEFDDLVVVSQLSQEFPLVLHVDAFRSFDYVTVFLTGDDQQSIEKLRLGARDFKKPVRAADGTIFAGTVVAGCLNHSYHDPAIALKPASLGRNDQRISWVRSPDSTISGSRDGIVALWLALYEMRLGDQGLWDVCQHLVSLRTSVMQVLNDQSISAFPSPYSTDILVRSCSEPQKKWLIGLGGETTSKGEIILAMNPRFSSTSLCLLLREEDPLHHNHFRLNKGHFYKDFVSLYPIPQAALDRAQTKMQSWPIRARTSIGYPGQMSSQSALGPIIGQFLDIQIPKDWVEAKSSEALTARMEAFGLDTAQSRRDFKGAITTGSTMGNRCGIMAAFAHFPNGYLYFPSESHYSVIKALRDCDTLTNRWTGKVPQYAEIRCNKNGSMRMEDLVSKAIADQKRCAYEGTEYHMIIFANMGTTFLGGRDDILSIHQELAKVGIQMSYIHIDGALDFGFETCGIKLGPCCAIDGDGRPFVQGITVSHHKAMGQNVSGEILCYSPENQLSELSGNLDQRAVFETWFFNQVHSPDELALLLSYCRDNASHVEAGLRKLGVVTRRYNQSNTVAFERPPAWVCEDFCLRPEGDWVHLITMQHVSKGALDCFLDHLSFIDKQFSFAFSCVKPLLADILGRAIELRRVGCCSALAERVSGLSDSLVPLHGSYSQGTDSTIDVKSTLRGAVSVVAIDEQDEIQAVFLAGSTRDKSIHIHPVLIRKDHAHVRRGIVNIARLLMALAIRQLGAGINQGASSYDVYLF
ncbi:PLP-dependent transferase [Xylaria palmicola]|nr:PLP-dependent transferase [Xylaria palmicola]